MYIIRSNFIFSLMIILIAACFTGCSTTNISANRKTTSNTSSETNTSKQETLLENELEAFRLALTHDDLDGMHLTVYYMDVWESGSDLNSVNDLIERSVGPNATGSMFEVDNDYLVAHKDALHQLNSEDLIPYSQEEVMHARVCFIFETSTGPVLEIVFNGYVGNSVYVNDIPVTHSTILPDFVKPLVPAALWNRWDRDFMWHTYPSELP